MNGWKTQSEVANIKQKYPVGTRVELVDMNELTMPSGLKGIIDYVDDQGQLHTAWENGSSLALVPGEDVFHILPALEHEKSGAEKFTDHINSNILPFIDYHKLAKSYCTEDKAYAKGILNCLHTAMIEQYGSTTLTSGHRNTEDDYVVVPGVIEGKKTGKIAIALLGIDLASSGEHCQTDILCHYGIVPQGDKSQPPYISAEVSVDYMPYDYGYTATIPGDIHVSKNSLPDGIKEMLGSFQNHTAELLQPNTKSEEEQDMER